MRKVYLSVFFFIATSAHAMTYRIVNLAVQQATDTRVVLTCTVPKVKSGTAPVTKIELRIDDAPITAKNYDQATIVQVVNNPGVTFASVTFTVAGLQPNTTYYFACRAFDTEWNEVSNYPYIKTGPPSKNTPVNKTIRVYLDYKEDDSGEIPDAVVVFHGSTRALMEKPLVVKGDVDHVDITGLKQGDLYYWQVVTVSIDGEIIENPVRSDSR